MPESFNSITGGIIVIFPVTHSLTFPSQFNVKQAKRERKWLM
ncbi:hypothetical protein S1OALGB6SA_1775 [Olavius algarvensis spirochete endosymbiont]|nr:hypothetical protein S1OALGB6SA_1775 [Olavius algarvensis spirochete endosymbiont]